MKIKFEKQVSGLPGELYRIVLVGRNSRSVCTILTPPASEDGAVEDELLAQSYEIADKIVAALNSAL